VLHYIFQGDIKNALAVWKGYAGFFRWLFTIKDQVVIKLPLKLLPGVFHGSVVWNYYVKGKKTFRKLRK
jgi:hypothetical protein